MRRLLLASFFVSALAVAQVGPASTESQVASRADGASQPLVWSLADAVGYAREHSPRLHSARAAIERARGEEQVAFAPFLPELDLLFQSGATSSNLGPGITGPTGHILTSTPGTRAYAQSELRLEWILLDFGRRSGRHDQAAARQRMAELRLIRADQTVQFDVTTAYLNILLAHASLRVQEDAIRQAEATLKDTRARFTGGVADPNDVLRAEVQLSESREAAVNAEEAEALAVAQLNNVMGRDASLPLDVVDLQLPPPETRPSLAQDLEVAAAQRAEAGFAREAVAAARAGATSARADLLPRISLRASGGRVDGAHVQTGWQAGTGLHLELPLYTGGRVSGEIHAAEAEVTAATADAQVILDAISLEVDQAYRSELAAGQRVQLSRPTVTQAQENLRLVRVRYRNGDATPTDIADAQAALTRSQQRYASATYAYLAAVARLDFATGREQQPRRGGP